MNAPAAILVVVITATIAILLSKMLFLRRAGFFALAPSALPSSPVHYIWPFPAVIGSAIVVGWGAEIAEFFISQGMALAILAWLQVLPEFTVEAAIAHQAALTPDMIHLITANFTGSNRILVGLGWPLIFFTTYYFSRKKGNKVDEIKLRDDHSIEIMALLVPTVYFVFIYLKGTLTLLDSVILSAIYIAYLWILGKMPPEDANEAQHVYGIPKKVLSRKKRTQIIFVIAAFVIGGSVIFFSAEPFLFSMLGIAAGLGISEFLFIQWVAPFLSEFPEKVTAFRWATTVHHAPTALMNMISSKINQWTVLVAMIPLVYVVSLGRITDIPLGGIHEIQRVEIMLTIAQSVYAISCLLKMRFTKLDASLLLSLWLVQFVIPGIREEMILVYLALSIVEVVRHRKEILAFKAFKKTIKIHVLQEVM
jgi:cation:H+ antiporter